jgi:PAS domain S-box-containing protein
MRPRTLLLLGALALLGSIGAAWLIAVSDHTEDKIALGALALTAGITFVVSGLVATWRRPANRTGTLLIATGFAWLAGSLTTANAPWLFTFGFLFNALAFAPLGHALLAYPTGELRSRLDRALVALTYLIVTVPALALLLVGETDRVCGSACPESTIAVTQSPTTGRVLVAAISAGAVAIVLAVLLVLARRWRDATPALRRALAPVFATAATMLLLLALAEAVASLFSSEAARPLSLAALAAFGAVPFAFLVGILRSRLARAGVGDLLLELGRGVPLRDALARALHDPTLDLAFWLPRQQRFVHPDGKEFREELGKRPALWIERNGKRVGAIVHDPSLADEHEVIDAVCAAAGLWLDNEILQAELRAQLEFLETIVNTAPALLCSLDLEGRIVNLNDACTETAGADDEEELRGQYFWDVFISPEERAEVVELFAAAAPDFEPGSFEHGFVNRRGEQVYVAWSGAPIRDDEGEIRSLVLGGADVTIRRRRELELEVERDFAGAVANTIPILLVGVHEDGTINEQGPNPAFETILGWRGEEIVGRSLLDLIAEEDRYLALMAIGSAANGVPVSERESRWLARDGGTRTIVWTAQQILGIDGRTLVLVSGADVTDRKRQEEEVRASRARIVEAGDAARRRLERNLHDGAQQRLVSLSLALRLAQAKLESDPASAGAVLESAREELALALDELRELARGIHPAILTDRGLAAALEALATRSPIPVEIESRVDGLPDAIEAAAYYVVAESLANVVKYAQATTVRVRIEQDEECLAVEVADDGVGGADPSAGTGLRGLTDRVEALDGSLAVESPPGEGTRIRAELPLQAAPQGAQGPPLKE